MMRKKLNRALIEARISAAKNANEVAQNQLRALDLNKLSPSQNLVITKP